MRRAGACLSRRVAGETPLSGRARRWRLWAGPASRQCRHTGMIQTTGCGQPGRQRHGDLTQQGDLGRLQQLGCGGRIAGRRHVHAFCDAAQATGMLAIEGGADGSGPAIGAATHCQHRGPTGDLDDRRLADDQGDQQRQRCGMTDHARLFMTCNGICKRWTGWGLRSNMNWAGPGSSVAQAHWTGAVLLGSGFRLRTRRQRP
jgi:hypothetical protein